MADSAMNEGDFRELLLACHEIASFFPEGVIFIGGIAVYLHAINTEDTREFAAFTHDADFYISLADMADLRDIEEVVANRRLSKHQLIKRGFEFDIYTERHSALIVPYDQVAAHAVRYDTIRVASLEHLLVLKLEAYRDRQSSAKGQKDAMDVIRIVLTSLGQRKPLTEQHITPYLSDEHEKLLERIQKGPEFMSMAAGNAKLAKTLREKFAKGIAAV